MELLTVIVVSVFTSLAVSALFHWFTVHQACKWIEKFFDEQEKEMEKFFADLKVKLLQ